MVVHPIFFGYSVAGSLKAGLLECISGRKDQARNFKPGDLSLVGRDTALVRFLSTN